MSPCVLSPLVRSLMVLLIPTPVHFVLFSLRSVSYVVLTVSFSPQSMKILGVNEAWGELGVVSHQLRFTERIEVEHIGPVQALTSSLHTLLSQ